jgi:hypothetical protein
MRDFAEQAARAFGATNVPRRFASIQSGIP